LKPTGLSAIVRCKNEEEYIAASLLSAYRVFDELVVVLNDSTDRTREILDDLRTTYTKIRVLTYDQPCSQAGVGYLDNVRTNPESSLARYYNWSFAQARFSHVCKWDGDMIALPALRQLRPLLENCDVILFDGYDAVGEHTTEIEARVFRYDANRTRYIDWDLYEVLQHDYTNSFCIAEKCYVHMKLVKKEWLHKPWSNPNDFATSAYPAPSKQDAKYTLISRAKRVIKKLKGALGRK
jgi:glycosyltransferase involved in cell wall biosynthesis